MAESTERFFSTLHPYHLTSFLRTDELYYFIANRQLDKPKNSAKLLQHYNMGGYCLIDSAISVVIVLKTLQPSTTYYNVTPSRDGSEQGNERGFLQK